MSANGQGPGAGRKRNRLMTALVCALVAAAPAQAQGPVDGGAAARGRLDRYPDHAFEAMDRARQAERAKALGRPARRAQLGAGAVAAAATTSVVGVFLKDTRWKKRKLTIAFDGGDDRLRRLIEAAANEWTAEGGRLRLSFRDRKGRFRTWSAADSEPAADIRITFADEGYWSLIGRLAAYQQPGEATMGFAGFDTLPDWLVGDAEAWRQSYQHAAVLHEFGHALGLAHEQFHPDCQQDLKLDSDPGYEATFNGRKEYIADSRGRSPGALLVYPGPPNEWDPDNAAFNLDSSVYRARTLQEMQGYFEIERLDVDQSREIDRRSVMLYWLRDYLLESGTASACRAIGDGNLDGDVFATTLSRGDRSYFRRYYR